MTRVYFAGAEVETLARALMDGGVKHVLWSYYYIQEMRREKFIEKLQNEYPDVSFILDSGAFTYWSKFKSEPHKLMPWRVYRRRYFQYIDATWDKWARIAELDLDETFPDGKGGYEITYEMLADWREEMIDRWPAAPIMPVWHGMRGPEEWTSYVRDPRFRYLAIGSGNPGLGFVRKLILEAHQWNKLVHGFGMTRVATELKHLPYDTVDSTSWLMGQKFGTIFIFRNNMFRRVGKDGALGKNERRLYRKHFTAIGVDWKKIEADDVAEVRKANILAWRRLGDRLDYMRSLQKKVLPENATGDFNEDLLRDSPLYRAQTDRVEYSRSREDLGVASLGALERTEEVVSKLLERTDADYAPERQARERGRDEYGGTEGVSRKERS